MLVNNQVNINISKITSRETLSGSQELCRGIYNGRKQNKSTTFLKFLFIYCC